MWAPFPISGTLRRPDDSQADRLLRVGRSPERAGVLL